METQDTPLPRGAGADVPQSELSPGAMALEYTEQNFNALVAANSAMQSELASNALLIADLRDRVDDNRATISTYLTQIKDLQQDKKRTGERIEELSVEVDYERDRANALQRKLDRSLGYIDRIVDDQEAHREQPKLSAPLPPIGPDLGSVPNARRRRGGGHDEMEMMFPGADIRFRGPERPRRY